MSEVVQDDEAQQESAMRRVSRLPLVHSAFQILSFAYQDVRTRHPVLDQLCSLSEGGVRGVTRVAASGLSPILSTLEPQLAVVNRAAVRLVEELEVRLPVLDQPADEVVSGLRAGLVGRVEPLWDWALNGMQSALDRARALVTDTREAASLAAGTLGSLGELARLGAELASSQAQHLIDQYLPEEEDGAAQESSTSEESGDSRYPNQDLLSRWKSLVSTVVSRSLKRLNPYLDQGWRLLHGAIGLLLSFPYKLQSRSQRAVRTVLFGDGATEDPKRANTVAHSPTRLVRSPNQRIPYAEASISHRRVLTFGVEGRRCSQETEENLVGIRYNRRQSLDNSFYPPSYLDD